jgi:dipeptidyl aminopeptidase/acylaminoacyl peptidase
MVIVILWVTIRYSPQSNESTSQQSELLTFLDGNGHIIPVSTKTEWNQKRLQILDDMQEGMGELPEREELRGFDLHFTDSMKGNNYKRYSIHFLVAENERVTAYLYIPDNIGKGKRIPAMLALHDSLGKGSVDGQGVNQNLGYAKELAQRGYIVIVPDYPGFGESQVYDFEHDRYQSGTMKGIFNHMRCVDLLQSMLEVDAERIGVIGHSSIQNECNFLYEKKVFSI